MISFNLLLRQSGTVYLASLTRLNSPHASPSPISTCVHTGTDTTQHWRDPPQHWRDASQNWRDATQHWRGATQHWRDASQHWHDASQHWGHATSHWRHATKFSQFEANTKYRIARQITLITPDAES